jgi:hypothetical protein
VAGVTCRGCGRGAELAEFRAGVVSGGAGNRQAMSVRDELRRRGASALVDGRGSCHRTGDALLRYIQAPTDCTERETVMTHRHVAHHSARSKNITP